MFEWFFLLGILCWRKNIKNVDFECVKEMNGKNDILCWCDWQEYDWHEIDFLELFMGILDVDFHYWYRYIEPVPVEKLIKSKASFSRFYYSYIKMLKYLKTLASFWELKCYSRATLGSLLQATPSESFRINCHCHIQLRNFEQNFSMNSKHLFSKHLAKKKKTVTVNYKIFPVVFAYRVKQQSDNYA